MFVSSPFFFYLFFFGGREGGKEGQVYVYIMKEAIRGMKEGMKGMEGRKEVHAEMPQGKIRAEVEGT